MKSLVLAGLATFALGGCAPVLTTKASLDPVACDYQQMDRVERQAKRAFASVVWINCPRAVQRVVG